jgi:hypothetical protein
MAPRIAANVIRTVLHGRDETASAGVLAAKHGGAAFFDAAPKVSPTRTRKVDGGDFGAKPAVDGKAFVASAIADIKARVARGEKVRAGFDIDDTLADTRGRTLALAKQWDQENGTHYFAKLTLAQVAFDAKDTARAMDLPWDSELSFMKYWDEHFLEGAAFKDDLPIPAIIDLARQAKAAGAEVVYLTGRLARRNAFTIEQLQRFGLTDANEKTVVGKPSQQERTPQFKTAWLQQSAKDGFHLAFFITESKRDIAAIQKGIAGVPTVLIDHAFNGPEAVRADTPVFPRPV